MTLTRGICAENLPCDQRKFYSPTLFRMAQNLVLQITLTL